MSHSTSLEQVTKQNLMVASSLKLSQLRQFDRVARIGQNVALGYVAHVVDGIGHVGVQVARRLVQCALRVQIVLDRIDVPD